MPPLYLMDDFERCFEQDPSVRNVYCYVRSQIKPNESSPLWKTIEVNTGRSMAQTLKFNPYFADFFGRQKTSFSTRSVESGHLPELVQAVLSPMGSFCKTSILNGRVR